MLTGPNVSCLKAGGTRLLLAIQLGLMLVPAYLVAPVLFSSLPTRAMAGQAAGEIFHLANWGVLVALILLLVFLRGKAVKICVIILLALVAVNEFYVAGVLADIKSTLGPIDDVSDTHPLRKSFGMWHGISAVIHLAGSVISVWLVARGLPSKGAGESCTTS